MQLNVERLIARAGATIAARGRAYYAQKRRFHVQRVSAEDILKLIEDEGINNTRFRVL
jgi:hypothetical protein